MLLPLGLGTVFAAAGNAANSDKSIFSILFTALAKFGTLPKQ